MSFDETQSSILHFCYKNSMHHCRLGAEQLESCVMEKNLEVLVNSQLITEFSRPGTRG